MLFTGADVIASTNLSLSSVRCRCGLGVVTLDAPGAGVDERRDVDHDDAPVLSLF